MKMISVGMRIGCIALAAALGAVSLFGCASQQAEEQSAQEANQAYMSQVNESMKSLDVQLDNFVDAVSRGDVVDMRVQADDAFAKMDELSSLEAPEALADIQALYIDGIECLETALGAYIDLYTEIDSATEANPFDWSTYDQRIAEIKAQYDEGIGLLEQGDAAAAEKK